jgi:hypothetical protein
MYTRSPELIHPASPKFCTLWLSLPNVLHIQPMSSPLLLSASMSFTFLDSTYKWGQAVLPCLFHLVESPLGSSLLLQMARLSSFLKLETIPTIPLCMYGSSHFPYSFIHKWTLRLIFISNGLNIVCSLWNSCSNLIPLKDIKS